MTEKEFLDVFPHLKVDAELEALMGAVKVMKVAVNPQKDCLRVYIMSSQWIHKKHIYHLEEAIREQFFENANLRVKIIENFPPVYPGEFHGGVPAQYSAGAEAVQYAGV